MKKIIISAITMASLISSASVVCDCNILIPVTANYELNQTIGTVQGLTTLDASYTCSQKVKEQVYKLLIKPKTYSSKLLNCVSSNPVVTE